MCSRPDTLSKLFESPSIEWLIRAWMKWHCLQHKPPRSCMVRTKEHPECAHLCLLKWQSGVASATALDAVGVGLGGLTLSSETLPADVEAHRYKNPEFNPQPETRGSCRRFLHPSPTLIIESSKAPKPSLVQSIQTYRPQNRPTPKLHMQALSSIPGYRGLYPMIRSTLPYIDPKNTLLDRLYIRLA